MQKDVSTTKSMIEERRFREPRCRPGYNSAELPWEYRPGIRQLEEDFRRFCKRMKNSGVYVICNAEHILYVGSTKQGGHRVGASLARVCYMINCDPDSLSVHFYPVGEEVLEDAEHTLIQILSPTVNYYRRYPRLPVDPRPPWDRDDWLQT